MTITDVDEERTVTLVLADVAATVGAEYESVVRANARRIREFADDPREYLRRIAEDTQQDLHDQFIDTTWPRCPLHGRHPLWYRDGAWWCEQDDGAVAPVGQLGTIRAHER